jgi:hypothetical protein
VQADYLPDAALVGSFATKVRTAGGDRWEPWSQEIFADLFSLLAIGQWALWALTDLLWGPAIGMLDAGSARYPPPLVRLLLMKAILDRLGLDGGTALRGMTPEDFLSGGPVNSSKGCDLRAAIREDLEHIEDIADAVTNDEHTVELKVLLKFSPDDFNPPAGFVYLWSETMAERAQMVPHNGRIHARLVLAGGVGAWASVAASDAADRDKMRLKLKASLPGAIVENREESVRSQTLPAEIDLQKNCERLASLIAKDVS